jgi:hypothetical protein
MDGMPMDGMNMDDMAMGDTSMDHAAMADMASDAATVDISIPLPRLAAGEEALANSFDQPVQSCAHCLGHSGNINAPISSVSVPNQSNKDIGPVPLPGSSFLARRSITVAQIGLPREHAPPGNSAPRPPQRFSDLTPPRRFRLSLKRVCQLSANQLNLSDPGEEDFLMTVLFG